VFTSRPAANWTCFCPKNATLNICCKIWQYHGGEFQQHIPLPSRQLQRQWNGTVHRDIKHGNNKEETTILKQSNYVEYQTAELKANAAVSSKFQYIAYYMCVCVCVGVCVGALASPCSENYWVRSEKVIKELRFNNRDDSYSCLLCYTMVQCDRWSPNFRSNLLLHTSGTVKRGRWLLIFPNILHIETLRWNSFRSSELTMKHVSSSETSVIIHHNARRPNPA
jgi:hypothetical protein